MFTRLLPFRLFQPRLPGFASQCAVCRSWPARQLCQPCLARFAPVQRRCASCALALPADLSMGLRTDPGLCAACVRQRSPLDHALAAVPYAYPWSTLIAGYKFGEQPGWAAFFAALLLKTPGVLQAFSDLNANDWIVPVPLSAERLQTRDSTRPGSWPAHSPGNPARQPRQMPNCCCASNTPARKASSSARRGWPM
ncbi:hypothetical protein LP414_21695 [Polaromonas sp. P1(28)-13]|nr:hypothetical protein LP414_21695 [Polaromonas sp. P1(28)-13]